MSERKISVSVDSFSRSNDDGYASLGNLLATDVARECVSGLHYPANVLENFYLMNELRDFVSGRNALIRDATIVADISLSGGYATANRQLQEIQRMNPGAYMQVIVSHGMSNKGISALVEKHQKPGEVDFLLTGILPEDVVDDEKIDNVVESFMFNPEEFSINVIERAQIINKRYQSIAKSSGVIGLYGSARYSNIPRDDLIYVGAGVSEDGKPYESEGVMKHSTKLSDAIEHCDDIVVGHMIVDHPNGPIAGLEELRSGL